MVTKKKKRKLNCWQVMKCGRTKGGRNVKKMGLCPVAEAVTLDGVHGGKNAGRACWIVAGTFCDGEVQGTFANKLENCRKCPFYQKLQKEERDNLENVLSLMTRLHLPVK